MGSQAVLGEVFGRWSWQAYSPTDAAAAGFATRVVGAGGLGINVGLGTTRADQTLSVLAGRGVGFAPVAPARVARDLLQPRHYATGLLSGVTLKMEEPPRWARPLEASSLQAEWHTRAGSIRVSPQAKTWGLGLFPGRVAGAWLLAAGVAGDGRPALSAAGFLGALPASAPTPAAPSFRAFAGVGVEIRHHADQGTYQQIVDLLRPMGEPQRAAAPR